MIDIKLHKEIVLTVAISLLLFYIQEFKSLGIPGKSAKWQID